MKVPGSMCCANDGMVKGGYAVGWSPIAGLIGTNVRAVAEETRWNAVITTEGKCACD